mgnify:CR=1 FL=1
MKILDINIAFLNLGTGEVIILLLVILLLFGAKRLPELARGLGKGIHEFKDAVNTSKKEIIDATENPDDSNSENQW